MFLFFFLSSLEKIFQRLGWTEPAPDYMKKIVRQTIEKREKHNIVRKDMLQLLLQLRNTGKINGDEDEGWSAVKTKGRQTSWLTKINLKHKNKNNIK